LNIVTPAILIIGAILVAIVAAPIALFSRALQTSTFNVATVDGNVVVSYEWDGAVTIRDARLAVLVNGKVVGEDYDSSLGRGEELRVVLDPRDLVGETVIVFSGSVEGIYSFEIKLEVQG